MKFSGKVWSDHGMTWLHFWSIPRNRTTRGQGLLCFRTTIACLYCNVLFWISFVCAFKLYQTSRRNLCLLSNIESSVIYLLRLFYRVGRRRFIPNCWREFQSYEANKHVAWYVSWVMLSSCLLSLSLVDILRQLLFRLLPDWLFKVFVVCTSDFEIFVVEQIGGKQTALILTTGRASGKWRQSRVQLKITSGACFNSLSLLVRGWVTHRPNPLQEAPWASRIALVV